MVVNKKSDRNAVNKANHQKVVPNNKEAPAVTHSKLTPLLTTKPERLAAYKKRRDQYLYESISPSDTEKYETAGWILHKESKTRVRMKRLKQHNQTLDDQVWCLLYRMGYPELSGEEFRIGYANIDGSASEKKINVFAKDDETVVIVECKSKETSPNISRKNDK